VSHKPGGRLPLLSAMPRLDRGDEDELRFGDPLLLEPPADSDTESSFASVERRAPAFLPESPGLPGPRLTLPRT